MQELYFGQRRTQFIKLGEVGRIIPINKIRKNRKNLHDQLVLEDRMVLKYNSTEVKYFGYVLLPNLFSYLSVKLRILTHHFSVDYIFTYEEQSGAYKVHQFVVMA